MIDLTGQKTFSVTLMVVLALTLLAGVLAAADTRLMPWSFLVLAAGALLVACAVRGKVAFWIWLWVLSFGLLDRCFWVLELQGFFNLSIPRILFMAVVAMFFVHFLVRREPIRLGGEITVFMLVLLVYVAASASATGWTSANEEVRSAPYFRFFAGLLLPFLAFFLMYNAAASGKQIRWALVAITVYGFYSLYVAYIQGIDLLGGPNLRHLIWPDYINLKDVEGMIHDDRARGAFVAAGPQAVLLVFLFYVDLYLIRHLRGPYRAALAIQALLVLPALVFTGIRAGYVAFAICGVIWCVWGLRGRFGWVKLSISVLVIAVAAMMQWGRITGTERVGGGLAQRGPIQARLQLLKRTGQIVAGRPVFGVGFGHFVDAQADFARDAAEGAYTSGTLVEHNIFLNMAAETGMVGLAIYVALFAVLFRRSLKVWRQTSDQAEGYFTRGFLVLFWVMLANYLVSGVFRDMLWDPFANALLWSLAGLTLGLGRGAAAAKAEPSAESAQPAGR